MADENRAGEAKPAIDYREEMRRFVITISQYGKKFDKNFIVIPQNGLELVTNDGSASGELQQGYLREVSPWAPSRSFTDIQVKTNPLPPTQANMCLSSTASTRKTACGC